MFQNNIIEVMDMSFWETDVTPPYPEREFSEANRWIDRLELDRGSDTGALCTGSDAARRPAYLGLLLLGISNGGLSDESMEDMAN